MQLGDARIFTTTLNMIFSVTYYSDLRVPISFDYYCFFNQVKMLMFYSVQTTNLTMVGKT